MMRLNRTFLIAFLLGCVLLGSAPARAEGWLSNPFAKKKPTTKTASAAYRGSNASSKSWLSKMKMPAFPKMSMPKLSNLGGSKRTKQPSMLQKTKASAKNMYAKTKAAIAKPFSPKKPRKKESRLGSQSLGYGRGSATASKKKKSYFSRLFSGGGEKEREIKNVNDFLSQGRPEY